MAFDVGGDVAACLPEADRERRGLGITADVGEVVLEQGSPLRGRVEQPVDPAPGLGIVVLRHRPGRLQPLHASDVWPPGSFDQPACQMGDMVRMEPLIGPRPLEILGDALIEPERHRRHDGMDVAVGRFVTEILGHAILPGSEDRERRIGLDEEGSPWRQAREPLGDKGLIAGRILKKIEVDRLIRNRETELLANLGPHGFKLPDEPMLTGQRKVGVDQQLARGHRGAAGQGCRGG